MKHSKGNILIVEDDDGVAELQAMRLQRCGHIVTRARGAEETFTLLEQQQFDLVVLDYGLEGDINGVRLFMILRERGLTIPAILVTGFEDPKIIVEAMRAGVRDFLPKTPEYLADLPLSVERVMRQVALEREVAAAISVREKQELLEAAFDAARLASCVWDVKRNEIKWSGHTEQLFGFQVEEQCRDYDSFINLIFEEDRASARECISESSRTKAQFDCQFRIARPNSEIRWISAKGRFYFDKDGNAVRMIIVLNDFTQRKHHELELLRSHQQIKALNDRLQLSIVETHHRTKNSLQNVISLLHLHLRQHGSLNEEEVKKLTAHIQGLAVIHDVLVDQAKEEGNTGSIALDQVIERMLCVLDRASGSRSLERILTPCHVTSRQGASLSVIVNELVSNALKHGNGKVLVQMDVQGEQGTLDVINEGSTFPTGFNLETTNRTGLLLIQTLARADLRSEPNFENLPDGRARVRISFPTTVVKKVEVKPVETLH